MLSNSANPSAVVKTRKPADGVVADLDPPPPMKLADFHNQATGKPTKAGDGGPL